MTKDRFIPLATPTIGTQEKNALNAVVDDQWITMGPRVAEFETEFAAVHEKSTAVAVSSCTAALHLALVALDIQAGDEVLVPSLSFVATVNAVLYVGAHPLFMDIISTTSPLVDIESAKAQISSRTKAIIVMHYGGYLIDMEPWHRLAKENGVALIEDAAHAAGMTSVGTLSDLATFSFFGNKNMTTAEGGMLLGRSEKALERTRLLRSHGMTSSTLDRDRGHAYSYDVIDLGFNYRMDELRAAIGLVQIRQLKGWNVKRKQIAEWYRNCLSEYASNAVVPFDAERLTANHLLVVNLPSKVDRGRVMQALRENGIQTSIHYPPIHKFSYYRKRYGEIKLPQTEKFCSHCLTLPLDPKLTEDDVLYVSKQLGNALQ